MKITRIDSEKNINKEMRVLEISISNITYRIRETSEGCLEVHKTNNVNFDNTINIKPLVTNVIEII